MLFKNNEIIDSNIVEFKNKRFQVMMPWEKTYMEKCVEVLKPHGDVLEIGFGMGYSASAINKYPIRSYTIIEKDKNVIKNFNKWKLRQNTKKINLIEGMWQIKLPLLNKKFDCIFFDDSPSSEIKNFNNVNRDLLFIKLIMFNNIKNNTKYVSYCTNNKWFYRGKLAKNFEQDIFKYQIKIPYYCRYAKGNYMYIDRLKFKKNCRFKNINFLNLLERKKI